MLNPHAYYNSRPDGFAVLEVVDETPAPDAPRRFVPLKRTDLAGAVTGPLRRLPSPKPSPSTRLTAR